MLVRKKIAAEYSVKNAGKSVLVHPPVIGHKLEVVPLASLKFWKDNPRNNEAAAPKLAEILRKRGQVSPIIVWRKNMTVYKGNTTVKAAKLLAWKNINAIFVDFPSEQAAIAYGIEDNKSSEWATWDDSILTRFLSDEKILAAGAAEVFSEKEKSHLLSSGFDKGVDVDSVPEYNEEEDTFSVRVDGVKPADKEFIVQIINDALKGYEYGAVAY